MQGMERIEGRTAILEAGNQKLEPPMTAAVPGSVVRPVQNAQRTRILAGFSSF
jgi:hypothetical protein